MQTVTDNLKEMANKIKEYLEDLLLNHSSMYKWMNDSGPSIIILDPYGDYSFHDLDIKGRQIQSQLLDKYQRFADIISVLIKNQTQDTLTEFSEFDELLKRVIEQNHTWLKTPQEVLDKSVEALESQLDLLNRLYDASSGEVTYIPDTNALLYNTDLESWEFDKTPRFTLVLLPTVLEELDDLKITHKNEDIRKKSEKLIRKIKEYRRRGKLATGVTLVNNVSKLQSIAVEPNMGNTLSWLDPSNKDDRILAGVIEVMRTRIHSPVIIVTRAISLT